MKNRELGKGLLAKTDLLVTSGIKGCPMVIPRKLFDEAIIGKGQDVIDFITSLLQASTEYSIIGKALDGTIILWNEGARRLYGYEPEEVIGKIKSDVLHIPEDVQAGKPQQMREIALKEGKWEGIIKRRRKNGEIFTAKVTMTPRYDLEGNPFGFLLISEDITKDVEREDALKASQIYANSIFESSVNPITIIDTFGVVLDVNKKMISFSGVSKEKLIGSFFKDYFTDPELALEAIRKVLKQNSLENFELIFFSGNEKKNVYMNASVFLDAAGKLKGVLVSLSNITEQKILEHQLKEKQSYTRSLIEASIDGFFTVDKSGVITDVNHQFCEMTGYPREEIIGSLFESYFLEVEKSKAGISEAFEKGYIKDLVLGLATRNKEKILISLNASIFQDASGTIIGLFATARDITEKTVIQGRFEEERAYYRGLIETSLDGLVMVDFSMTISDVNESFCKMTGYSRKELLNTPFPQYFVDPKKASEAVRIALEKKSLSNFELKLRKKDGDEILISLNASLFKDGIEGVFVSARDITSSAQLQAQILEERSYNRKLIEASVDGLLTVDQSLTVTDVNETLCKMIGRLRNQIIGSPFSSLFKEADKANQGVQQTFEKGSVSNYVLTLKKADGQPVPVSLNAAIFKDSADKVRGIFASARDISSQQKLEKKLDDSQFYTRSLIESSIDPLVTTDPLGVITDVNSQMEALTGYARSEMIGSPFKGYFTDPEMALEGIKKVLQKGRVINYELIVHAKDGKKTAVSYNASIFKNREGELLGVFAAARDITDQKLLEEELRNQRTYLRGLIESSADGLVTVDMQGIINDVNERMCQMSGYSRTELIGSPYREYFTDPERAVSGVEQTLKQGSLNEYVLTLLTKAQKRIEVSFNASVFKGPSGNIAGIFASARDITERIHLEEQLKEQRTYLRGLIETSLDGLLTLDLEGYITDVNKQTCLLLGFERKELIGTIFKNYFPNPSLIDECLRQIRSKEAIKNYELVLKSKRGQQLTISLNASIFKTEEGGVEGIFVSARDISEQAVLQKKLVQQQAYNRSLIEASPDAFFAVDADNSILDVNEEATLLTGYSKKHLIGSSFGSYFSDLKKAEEGVKLTFQNKRVANYELELIKRGGRQILVSFNAGLFTDINGAPLGILAVARDVTQQHELQIVLKNAQLYNRTLIESNIDALVTIDPLGLITDVNQQMEHLTGFSRQELIGSPFKNYFTDSIRAEEGVKQVLKDGKVTNYELVIKSKGEKETVVSFNATTFYDQKRELQGIFASARDVTNLKQYEKELQGKNVDLENANKLKDRFLAMMSHELRTPLTSIIGFSGTLLMKLPGPLNAEQESHLRMIQKSSQKLLLMINELLDVAKIQAGKIELNLEEVNCQTEVENVAHEMRSLAEEKLLSLQTKIPKDPLVAKIDKRFFNQILVNLIGNAIKFTEKGVIEIILEEKKLENGPWISVSVTDTGIGIRPEEQKKLFTAFGRLETKIQATGTGLGLFISQSLAHLMDGRIECKSEFGKGSCFTLLIPKK